MQSISQPHKISPLHFHNIREIVNYPNQSSSIRFDSIQSVFDSIRFDSVCIRLDSIRFVCIRLDSDSIHSVFDSIRFDSLCIRLDSIRSTFSNLEFDSIQFDWIESGRIELFDNSIRFRSLICTAIQHLRHFVLMELKEFVIFQLFRCIRDISYF